MSRANLAIDAIKCKMDRNIHAASVHQPGLYPNGIVTARVWGDLPNLPALPDHVKIFELESDDAPPLLTQISDAHSEVGI